MARSTSRGTTVLSYRISGADPEGREGRGPWGFCTTPEETTSCSAKRCPTPEAARAAEVVVMTT
jgi:hypothetical protein